MLQFSYFQVLLLMAAAVSIGAAIYVSQYRKYIAGVVELITMYGMVAVLSIVSIFQYMFTGIEEKLLFTKLSDAAYICIGALWMMFLLKTLVKKRNAEKYAAIVVYGLSAICILFALLNPGGSFYGDVTLKSVGGTVFLEKSYGRAFYFWYTVILAYAVALFVLVVDGYVKKKLVRKYLAALVFAFAVTLCFNLLYDFGVTDIDWTPVGMMLSVLMITFALHRQFVANFSLPNRQVFSAMRDGVIELDAAGNLLHINEAARGILGVSEAAASGDIIEILENNFVLHTDEGIVPQLECDYVDELGKQKRLAINISELMDNNRRRSGVLLFIRDDTDYRHQQEMLNYLENYDGVTGLPNRKMFMSLLLDLLKERDGRANEKIAVVACNIDRFREYNEIYGLEFGDRLLQHFAAIFKRHSRDIDICARFSADEFYLLLPNLRDDGAEYYVGRVLSRIMRELEHPILIDDQRINASLRAGVSICPDDLNEGETPDSLMTLAAAAMESAKCIGKNQYCFYSSELHAKIEERFSLAQEMFEALEQNQFFVVYQPQIDYFENRVAGVEALCRWQNPVRGNIPPSTFIPIAEDTGLISSLGLFVIEEVCKLAQNWIENGLDTMKFSINLSIRQLLSDTIANRIISIVETYGIPPEKLVFEVTESIAMTNETQVIKELNMLRDYGFGIAIDDFAMGHSSFLYLKKFSVSTLKIDKVLSENVQSDAVSLAVIHALCVLSESLDSELIVEFVETKEQLDLLVEQGCRVFQGYYYSPPLIPEECFDYVANFSRYSTKK